MAAKARAGIRGTLIHIRAITMNDYRPDAADAAFVLFDVLQAHETLAQLPGFADNADPDLLRRCSTRPASSSARSWPR